MTEEENSSTYGQELKFVNIYTVCMYVIYLIIAIMTVMVTGNVKILPILLVPIIYVTIIFWLCRGIDKIIIKVKGAEFGNVKLRLKYAVALSFVPLVSGIYNFIKSGVLS